MSRSRDGTPTMSRPSMRIDPSSISSSPASMRSAVVLPQPDGPTMTTNSPSLMASWSASTAGRSAPG